MVSNIQQNGIAEPLHSVYQQGWLETEVPIHLGRFYWFFPD